MSQYAVNSARAAVEVVPLVLVIIVEVLVLVPVAVVSDVVTEV
jgi:hypothetical protein